MDPDLGPDRCAQAFYSFILSFAPLPVRAAMRLSLLAWHTRRGARCRMEVGLLTRWAWLLSADKAGRAAD